MTEYQLFGRNILIKRVGCGKGDSMGVPIPPSLNLFVKVTNGCNANCPFCSNAGHTQERHLFDVDKLFACIDEILNQRIVLNRLNITGGEPSIVPETVNRIIERLDASPDYQRIHLHLNTNGLLPKSQEMMRITRFDSISISMHHYDMSVLSELYNCHIPSRAIDFEGIDISKINLSCNLIKGYIDSPEEAKKMLDKGLCLSTNTARSISSILKRSGSTAFLTFILPNPRTEDKTANAATTSIIEMGKYWKSICAII